MHSIPLAFVEGPRAVVALFVETLMLLSRSIFLKLATASVVAAAALSGAGSASAGPSWSLGIAAPGVVFGVGESGPVFYEPAPVYSRPAPAFYPPAPAAYYAPAPIYYEPAYRGDGRRFHRRDWDGDRHGDRRHWERERRDHRREWNDRD